MPHGKLPAFVFGWQTYNAGPEELRRVVRWSVPMGLEVSTFPIDIQLVKAQPNVGTTLKELLPNGFGDGMLEVQRFVVFELYFGCREFLQRGDQMFAQPTSRTGTRVFATDFQVSAPHSMIFVMHLAIRAQHNCLEFIGTIPLIGDALDGGRRSWDGVIAGSMDVPRSEARHHTRGGLGHSRVVKHKIKVIAGTFICISHALVNFSFLGFQVPNGAGWHRATIFWTSNDTILPTSTDSPTLGFTCILQALSFSSNGHVPPHANGAACSNRCKHCIISARESSKPSPVCSFCTSQSIPISSPPPWATALRILIPLATALDRCSGIVAAAAMLVMSLSKGTCDDVQCCFIRLQLEFTRVVLQ